MPLGTFMYVYLLVAVHWCIHYSYATAVFVPPLVSGRDDISCIGRCTYLWRCILSHRSTLVFDQRSSLVGVTVCPMLVPRQTTSAATALLVSLASLRVKAAKVSTGRQYCYSACSHAQYLWHTFTVPVV